MRRDLSRGDDLSGMGKVQEVGAEGKWGTEEVGFCALAQEVCLRQLPFKIFPNDG